jgi:beta-phosphoglucomutase-like phosphatase (HAD superfamily)
LKATESIFKGVVFDLDGVIVDSHPLHKQAWHAFLTYIDKDVTETDLDFILEGRKRREILIHFLGELSDSEITLYGDKKDELFRQALGDLRPISGSIEFIQCLRQANLPMAVATSASRQRAHWTLDQLELTECFDVVVTGDDVNVGKPDPAIYETAARRPFAFSKPAAGDRRLGLRSSVGEIGRTPLHRHCAQPEAHSLIEAGADRVLPSLMNVSTRDLESMFDGSRHRGQRLA